MVLKSALLAVWLTALLGTMGALITDAPEFVRDGDPIAVLSAKSGDVRYRPGDVIIWSEVIPEQMLFEGDNIATAASAKARVDFIDGRSVLLGANTQITVASASAPEDSSFVGRLQEWSRGGVKLATRRKTNDVVTVVKGSVVAGQSKERIDIERVKRRQKLAEQALAAQAVKERQQRRDDQKRMRRLLAAKKKDSEKRRALRELQKTLTKRRFAKMVPAPVGKKTSLAARVLPVGKDFGLEKLAAVNLTGNNSKLKSAVPLMVKSTTKTFEVNDNNKKLALYQPLGKKPAKIKNIEDRKENSKPILDELEAEHTPKESEKLFKPTTRRLFIAPPRISSPDHRAIMWAQQPLSKSPSIKVHFSTGVRDAGTIIAPIIEVRGPGTKRIELSPSNSGQRYVRLRPSELVAAGFASKYNGLFTQLDLQLRVGVLVEDNEGNEDMRWSSSMHLLKIRSFSSKYKGAVVVKLKNAVTGSSADSKWIYQKSEVRNSSLQITLRKASDLKNITRILKGSVDFSIVRSSGISLGTSVFVANGRELVARIDGNVPQKVISALRHGLRGDLAFRGPAKIYLRYPEIVNKSRGDRRKAFLVKKGKLISFDKSFLKSDASVRDFMLSNFAGQLKNPPLEVIDWVK